MRCENAKRELIFVLYHAVGYALIVACSKKTISREENVYDL